MAYVLSILAIGVFIGSGVEANNQKDVSDIDVGFDPGDD